MAVAGQESTVESVFADAALLFSSKQYQQAIVIYSRLVNVNGKGAGGLESAGKTVTSSDSVRALNNISACYASMKEYPAAVLHAKKALEIHCEPDQLQHHAQSWFRLACAYEGQRQYGEATGALRQALVARPNHLPYLEAMQRVETASRQRAAPVDPKSSFYFAKSLKDGITAMKNQNYSEAIRLFSKALELFPPSEPLREKAILLSNRSAAYLKKSQCDESANDALAATRLDPLYSRGFFRLACAQEQQKQYASALTSVESSLSLSCGEESHVEEARRLKERLAPVVEQSKKSVRERLVEEEKVIREQYEKKLEGRIPVSCVPARLQGGYSYCTYCNESGHVRAECPMRRSKRPRQ